MKPSQSTPLSPMQRFRLGLVVKGLNLIHGLRTISGEPVQIDVKDFYIRKGYAGIYDVKDRSKLLAITPDVLCEPFVRALHICYEQLQATSAARKPYASDEEPQIPPVVSHILDNAEDFRELMGKWGA